MSSRHSKPSGQKINLPSASQLKIGIAVSEWHPEVTEELFEGAVKFLVNSGVSRKNIVRMNIPGSYELPLAARFLFRKKMNGVICLGCVIKGETDHNEYICQAVSNGILSVSIDEQKPVGFGLLTTHSLESALDRAGGKVGNKGVEAAEAVLKMLALS